MACYKPLTAYRTFAGDVVFAERSRHDIVANLELPCGRCIGCRLERSRQWSVRCQHEAMLHRDNCFVTLTYDSDHLPAFGSLVPRHAQLFVKRLRKLRSGQRFKFYMCGEYGEQLGRPHYHFNFFGLDFRDRKVWRKSQSGYDQWTSQELSRLWTYGRATVSDFSSRTAAYTARYVIDKINGDAAQKHYSRVDPDTGEVVDLEPEFSRMSKGIGEDYLRLYYDQIFPTGHVVVDGREQRAPRYYDRKLKRMAAMDEVQYNRWLTGRAYAEHGTAERLAVREVVAKARLSLKQRHKELS